MYSRQGAHLSEEKRKEYEQLMNTIIEKQNEFSKNLAEEKTELRFKEKDLKGVPETTMSGFRRDGEDFIVTMKYPDVMPIMDHCDVEETRRIVLTAFNSRGGPKNLALLEETIKLRQKAAVLLGYPDFPTYKLETEMAENPQNVKSFLTDLRAKLTERGKEEVRELTELKHQTGGEGSMQAWDFSYYMTLLKEKKFDVNEEEIQQYLPTEHVIKEMMKIYEEIFGLSFKEYVFARSALCVVLVCCVWAVVSVSRFIHSLTSYQLNSLTIHSLIHISNLNSLTPQNPNSHPVESTTTTSGSTRSRRTACTMPMAPCRDSSSSTSIRATASTRTPACRTSRAPPSSTASTTSFPLSPFKRSSPRQR